MLHVFSSPAYAKVVVDYYGDGHVADISEAAVAKLSLGVPPNRVSLYREKDGKATGDARLIVKVAGS
jgi:hypothetical protein